MTDRDRRKRTRDVSRTPGGTAVKKRARRPPHVTNLACPDDLQIRIHAIAKRNWIPPAKLLRSEDLSCSPEQISVVSDIYRNFLCSENAHQSFAALVETDYFEAFLWPVYCGCVNTPDECAAVSLRDILNSVLAVFLYGLRRSPEFTQRFIRCFDQDKQTFTKLCHSLFQKPKFSISCQAQCLRTAFLTEMFRLCDNVCVRDVLEPFASMPIWINVSLKALQEQAQNFPTLRRQIKRLARRAQKKESRTRSLEEDGLLCLLEELESEIAVLSKTPSDSALQSASGLLTLFAELVSQPRTRTFVLPLLEDRLTLLLVQGLTFALGEQRQAVSPALWAIWEREVDWFAYFISFPHDVTTGHVIPRDMLREKHSELLTTLQSTVYAVSRRRQLPPDHPIYSIPQTPQGSLGKGSILRSAFMRCEDDVLNDVRESLSLTRLNKLKQTEPGREISNQEANQGSSRMLVIGAMTYLCITPGDSLEKFRNSPMMIQEGDLWSTGREAPCSFASTRMPHLNTEFLNIQDYLMQNFILYKAEAATAIRKNMEATFSQMQPFWNGETYEFVRQSSEALSISSSHVTKNGLLSPDLSSSMNVRFEFTVDFSRCSSRIRREWEDVQSPAVLFLVKLGSSNRCEEKDEKTLSQDGLTALVSNAKVRGILIEPKKAPNSNTKNRISNDRVFAGFLDTIQFKLDSQDVQDTETNKSLDFDLIVRSPCKQNTLFPFLSTLRESLLNEEPCLPLWLEDILVRPAVSPDEMSAEVRDEDSLDFGDTFLSEDHLKASFSGAEVIILENGISSSTGRALYSLRILETDSGSRVEAEAYAFKNARSSSSSPQGPDDSECAMNMTEFDPSQIAAIRSGMKQGVTLLDGPPGTGKTSCVVQIITNLFHGASNERVLIVTRSNQALTEVVGRILSGNVNALRVLKLTGGEASCSDESMSPDGRVNTLLQRRIHLLSEVARLAACCSATGHFVPVDDWNCELADNFYQTVVREKWQSFMDTTDQSWKQFPFKAFFSEKRKAGREIEGAALEGAEEQSQDPLVAYSLIASLFADVEEMRFLEVLRHRKQRGSYVLTTYSRVVAMTGTYAVCHRNELIAEGFSYDTLILEEATGSPEVETFLSMVLQKRPVCGQTNRLKSVVLVGDHRQEPQIVDEELRNVCNLRQSMFHRLIRLGNNAIHLAHQKRSRKSIANLIRWQYPLLKDGKHILSDSRFVRANPGFAYAAQFIDTGDSTSEQELTANGFQNVVEAEFIAFVYIYMRLLGYPAERIALLTMYHSQVLLLKDTLESRLAQFPKVKGICCISTIDEFQGREADYVLVSLVRTAKLLQLTNYQSVTNALSRACLGVYVFGYLSRYDSLLDFKHLAETLPSSRRLTLVAAETFTDCDRSENNSPDHDKLPTREVHSPADMAAIVSHLYGAISANC